MKPGLDLKQYLRVMALLLRSPILFARASCRLIFRGLDYLAGNPDLAWARELLPPADSAASLSLLVLIAKKGSPFFSLLIANGRIKNLPTQTLRAFSEIDSFREKIEADLKLSLPAVLIDFAIFERINSELATEPGLDAFFIAGREILSALSSRQITFSPLLPEAEMLASLDGEELLAKFGPRYGMSLENPVHFSGVIRGLLLALLSPLTRWRMKKNFEMPGD